MPIFNGGTKYESMCKYIGCHKIRENNDPKRLGVKIDRNSKFNHSIFKKCKKAGGNLSAVTRNCTFMSVKRGKVLMNSFI